MFDLREFFSSEDFMPHGHCFLWEPSILWTHVISDALIALAYYSIPFVLVYFARKRPDMPFRHILVLFGAFILLCGTTHVISIWVLWHPDYGVEGIVKALTAATSLFTGFVMWRILPQLLTLPSPRQLQHVNQQLQSTYREVEERVKERTAALAQANTQLELAYSEAEKANQAKREFLANMSHEIRTPMNAIIGITSLLDSASISPEKQREFIKTMRNSAESMLALINDLLDIAKIESETITLDSITFDLKALTQEVISILAINAKEKSIALNFVYAPGMHTHYIGDPKRVRQILMNTISNAIKFTEQGSVNVAISSKLSEVTTEENICISITDTGIGIPLEHQEEIFNKFMQSDSSITRKYGGTGLGLAITRALVELMDGMITLFSELGKGSVFTLYLPLVRADAARDESSPCIDGGITPEKSQEFTKKTPLILLVEDNQPNILVATTILEQLGFHYEVAHNGEEAIAKAAQQSFDLIMMDVHMPVMDGYRATQLIRKQEGQSGGVRTPIIGITAYALAGDREKCLICGMDDYISKPFKTDHLQQKIFTLLGKGK